MNNNYALQIKNVTATTADVDIYSNTSPSTTAIPNAQIAFFKQSDPTSEFTHNFEDTGTPSGQKVATISLTGLSPKTEYAVHVNRPLTGTYYPFTTKVSPDTPRTATQSQWEDLASRVKTVFTGTDGTTAGSAGIVPAPAVTDAGKVLGADGNWVVGGAPVVQTLGTSTTDVMSQNATTKMIYPSLDNSAFSIYMNKNASDPGTALHRHIAIFPLLVTTMHDEGSVAIGGDTNKHNGTDEGSKFSTAVGFGSITNENGVAVGYEAIGRGILGKSVVIGASSGPSAINPTVIEGYVALGYGAGKRNESGTTISELGWVALGTYAPAGAAGQVNISVLGSNDTTERRRFGYNNSDYRLLSGLYDPQTAHDAATKGYCDAHIINGGTTAPTTSTVGTVGTLCSTVESGTGHLYICTSDTGGTYTWQTLI